jgi:hypothetical protein
MGVSQTSHRRGRQTRLGTAVLDSFSCLSAFSTCCFFRSLAKSNVEFFNFSRVQRIGEEQLLYIMRFIFLPAQEARSAEGNGWEEWAGRVEGRPGCQISWQLIGRISRNSGPPTSLHSKSATQNAFKLKL